jgi:hypothetical protein
LKFLAETTALLALAAGDGAAPVDVNFALAAANNQVVTVHDVQLEWRILSRRSADPDRTEPRTRDEQLRFAKTIVIDRLWLEHARQFPMWSEVVTRKMVDDEARELFGSLWADPSLAQEEHDLMRSKAESSLARALALQFDPEYRRCMIARPSDVRRIWETKPEIRRVPTRVTLGRVVLGRELHGAGVEAKAARLRQLAVEKGSLEAAAAELAPGDYSVMSIDDVERDQDVREDVLAFARQAEPFELSAPITGSASVMLFSLLQREAGREVSFEEAAPRIKELLQNRGCMVRAQQYFVFKILTESFFLPGDLFDDEIEVLMPGRKAALARQAGGRATGG